MITIVVIFIIPISWTSFSDCPSRSHGLSLPLQKLMLPLLSCVVTRVRLCGKERAQPTTFRIQISFLILVTGHVIGLLVLVDNNYCTSLASPTASSGLELKSETAPNSKSGTLRYFSVVKP